MSPSNYQGDIIPQNTAEDDSSFQTGAGQPLSEAEIDELLYDEDRPVAERLRLLRGLRDDIAEREPADFGDDDPGDLVDMITERIGELEAEARSNGVIDTDPLAHRETLAPDSDELDELEQDDEASLDEEDEWLDDEEEGDLDNDDDVGR